MKKCKISQPDGARAMIESATILAPDSFRITAPTHATSDHESIGVRTNNDNALHHYHVRPEENNAVLPDLDSSLKNTHISHNQLRFLREQTGPLSRSDEFQARLTVSTAVLQMNNSRFERTQTDVGAANSWRSHLQSRTQGTPMLPTHFALEEAHEAGSLPLWAARKPSLDLRQAASPTHINLMMRCASFSGWPSESGQCPRVMALAGFYYTGEDQRVCCFYCGLILDKWSPSDDPWDEHAQFRPSCQYLVKMRGQIFATQIQRKQTKTPV